MTPAPIIDELPNRVLHGRANPVGRGARHRGEVMALTVSPYFAVHPNANISV
jgi:hypothetical protein